MDGDDLRADWKRAQEAARARLSFVDSDSSRSLAATAACTLARHPTNADDQLLDLGPHPPVDLDDPRVSSVSERNEGEVDGLAGRGPLTTVAGVDISFLGGSAGRAVATVVLMSFPSLEILHLINERIVLTEPYIPSFLAFREGPPLAALVRRLQAELIAQGRSADLPDLLVVDGNGRLHERECGLACMLGLELDLPTIGVAKKPYPIPPSARAASNPPHWRSTQRGILEMCRSRLRIPGGWFGLFDESASYYVGAALIAGPTSNNPVFVSPGHKISLEMSLRLVRGLSEKARVPDPVRAADLAGRAEAKRWQAELDAVSFELE